MVYILYFTPTTNSQGNSPVDPGKMDSDLDKFFKESKPAALPEVAVKVLPKLEDLNKPELNGETVSEEDQGSKPLSRREKAKAKAEPEDRLRRTLFVGNLPVAICKSKIMQRALKKKFSAYGKLVSIRFRSVGFSKAMPRKIAFATQQFHEERDSVNAYVVMEKEEEAREAVKENSSVFEGRHIRVDITSADRKNDTKKSVFVGNLPLNISEETVWEFFGTCGQINNVRIVRDKKTNLGKGFGYVAFADKASIELALQLAGSDCGGRPIRISKCTKEGFHKETKLFKEKRKQAQEGSTDASAAEKTTIGFANNRASEKTGRTFKKPFEMKEMTSNNRSFRKPLEKTERNFKKPYQKPHGKSSDLASKRPYEKSGNRKPFAQSESAGKPFRIAKPTDRNPVDKPRAFKPFRK